MRELLLLALDGLQYGVWTEEIISRDVQVIHWLTTTARVNYAISSVNRQTLTLVDLSACLGLAPVRRERESQVLVIAQQEKGAGFIVEDIVGSLQVPSSAIIAVPPYLQTSVTDSCVVSGDDLIPVINLFELHRRIQETDFSPVKPDFTLTAGLQDKAVATSLNTIRLFACNGKPFAASSCNIQSQLTEVKSITGLTLMPDHIRGISLFNGKILPVIDLAVQLEQDDGQQADQVLIVEFGGQEFAFLVDSDIGILSSEHFSVQPLPRFARSVWFSQAVICNERIIPIIDVLQLLMRRGESEKEEISGTEVIGKPGFLDRFGTEVVKIIEFQMSGVCHALPEMEVKASIPFKPFREIPDADKIVAGVISHGDELIPVLDLARCFGKISSPDREWRLLLVENGSFRIFLMTGKVIGERILTREMQRDLPFVLPHSVVYGCYPFESSVRLILNIKALTQHFDEERAKEFFQAFSSGIADPVENDVPVPAPLKKKVEELFDSSEQVEEEEFAVTEYPELASVLAESEQLFSQDLVKQSPEEIEADELADREADKCAEKMLADAMAAYNAQVNDIPVDQQEQEPEPDSETDPAAEPDPDSAPWPEADLTAESALEKESETEGVEEGQEEFLDTEVTEAETADPEIKPDLLPDEEKEEETVEYPDVADFKDVEPVRIETDTWIKETDRAVTEKFDIDHFTSQVEAEYPEPDEDDLIEERGQLEEGDNWQKPEVKAYDVLKDFPELHAFAERVAQEQEQEQELDFEKDENSDLLEEFSDLLSIDLSKKNEAEPALAEIEPSREEGQGKPVEPEQDSEVDRGKNQGWRYAALTLTLLALAYLYMSGMLEKWYQSVNDQQKNVETVVPLEKSSALFTDQQQLAEPLPGDNPVSPVQKEKTAVTDVRSSAAAVVVDNDQPVEQEPADQTESVVNKVEYLSSDNDVESFDTVDSLPVPVAGSLAAPLPGGVVTTSYPEPKKMPLQEEEKKKTDSVVVEKSVSVSGSSEPVNLVVVDNDAQQENRSEIEPAVVEQEDSGKRAISLQLPADGVALEKAENVTDEEAVLPVAVEADEQIDTDRDALAVADNDTMTMAETATGTAADPLQIVPDESGHMAEEIGEDQNEQKTGSMQATAEELAEIIVYTVQEADTLWSIAEQYTGSGFNYTELAKQNKISNPDHIVPEQKIRIRKITESRVE